MVKCELCRNRGQASSDGSAYCRKIGKNVMPDDFCSWAIEYPKINRCSLCGGEAVIRKIGGSRAVVCKCKTCHNNLRTRYFSSADIAISEWNDSNRE